MDTHTRQLEKRVAAGDYSVIPLLARLYERSNRLEVINAYVVYYYTSDPPPTFLGIGFTEEAVKKIVTSFVKDQNERGIGLPSRLIKEYHKQDDYRILVDGYNGSDIFGQLVVIEAALT